LLLLLGIAQLIGGILAIAIPVVASLAAVAIFGAVLLVTGATQVYQAFKSRPLKGRALQVLGGVLYLIAAALILLFPLSGALTLTILVASLLIADGVVRCALAYRIKGGKGWGWMLAAGIASTFVGILLLIGWPLTGVWAIGILLGANLLFSGIASCVLAIMLRTRMARSAHPSLAGAHRHA
jgi:uncharacterized membrane protein HdeD (DUF308 family)